MNQFPAGMSETLAKAFSEERSDLSSDKHTSSDRTGLEDRKRELVFE